MTPFERLCRSSASNDEVMAVVRRMLTGPMHPRDQQLASEIAKALEAKK